MSDHPPPHPVSVDAQVGINLVRLRDLRDGMSQAALAEQMRARGWKWSQATVWSVEKGERPLRLAEAVALGDILHADLSAFTRPPMGDFEAELYDDIQKLNGLVLEVRVSVRQMYNAWRKAVTRYEWWSREGGVAEEAHPDIRRWLRRLVDPQGFTREIARAVRLAEDLHRPELISITRGSVDSMLEREDAFIEVIESVEEGPHDGEHPEEA